MVCRSPLTSRSACRLLAAALILGLPGTAVPAAAAEGAGEPAEFALTARPNDANPRLTGDFQGFSVESADFAHGFLTEERMARRLRTLGPGVIRLGGYSMDLVWPAFGAWSDVPAPPQAIGGTVDQTDLDRLRELLDATGWKVTLGAPLKTVIDPSKIKNPAKDPSPDVGLDQVVAEVKAAHETLGDDLVGVELGNEYDGVTTLTPAEMWQTAKRYKDAIDRALPHAGLKIAAPSPSGTKTSTRVDEFVTAALADPATRPQRVLSELASHWYPWSHCSGRTVSIEQLMSPQTHLGTREKVAGMMAVGDRLHDTVPSTINESNSASCSGMPGVSDSYATALWSLDYLLQTARGGVDRVQLHTNTAAVCGDFKPRDSSDYPISYRYYGAFCAADQQALDANRLSATPLYYGIWAFRQVPEGRFVDLDVADGDLGMLRAYAVLGERGALTVVVINVQDPAGAGGVDDRVALRLPSAYRTARAVTLESSAPAGFASLDAGRITLGGQAVTPTGETTGAPRSAPVPVDHSSATVTVAPGTAQIITFTH